MGGSGLGVGALFCVAAAGDLAPKDHQPRGLTAALCRPHRKDAATTTRCRRIATQRPTNHNDLQLQA